MQKSTLSITYAYDELGNLVSDWFEDRHIEWTASGKVKSVSTTFYPIIEFGYDARGERISKKITLDNSTGQYLNGELYETRYYLQTRNKWSNVPGGKWIGDILIPFLREQFAIAYEKRKTGILGNSIGARGAILTASSYPKIFGAAAGLSGFYDTIAITDNKLLISIYGEYDNFPKRWEDDDNIIKLAVNLRDTPVFLAHGKRDWKVNFEQARLLAIRLKQLQKGNKNTYKFEYHEKKYKFHDWKLWNAMLPFMMSFFDKSLDR